MNQRIGILASLVTAHPGLAALAMAVAVRGGQVPGVIMHTDQGSEGGFN